MMIRKAVPEDLKEILSVYECARAFMRENGNPTQWGYTFPPEDMLREDIAAGLLYVVCADAEIAGAFFFAPGPDPTYRVIENGKWLNDEPYHVVHRIAGSGRQKGTLGTILHFCEARAENVRIDTHDNNRVMQHLLEKYGYTRCGRIYVEDGSPRIAYQKVIRQPEN